MNTPAEVRRARLLKRRKSFVERAKKVAQFLLDELGATTSYDRKPFYYCNKCGYAGFSERHSGCKYNAAEVSRRRDKLPETTLYGWNLAVVPDGKLLDADGKPARLKIVKRFTHAPGDVVTSRAQRRIELPRKFDPVTLKPLEPKRYRLEPIKYVVQKDHSLRACTS